ncbi:MAG TPA: HNH endonuclease, partial [Polyangiaceae bacterium]|nr:HNH endonuclease [Polyangiaceae bacterium]
VVCRSRPWRHAANEERLSKNNGLLLAPHADFLFDRGFISFEEGRVIYADVADEKSLLKLGLDPSKEKVVGSFNAEQERFLEFHRREIFRKVIRKTG